MTREEILHLAQLARIDLCEAEIERFTKEFSDILAYVDQVKGLAREGSLEPAVGVVHNVFREDQAPHEGGIYTDDLLAAAPMREGGYVKVKKILGA